MRRMRIAVAAAAVAIATIGVPVAAAQAAPAPHPMVRALGDQPPFPYRDCMDAAKKKGEKPGYAKWHCDQLVKKGWVRRPKA